MYCRNVVALLPGISHMKIFSAHNRRPQVSLKLLVLVAATYPCIAIGQPVVTPNFVYHPGQTGLNGNELVTARGLTIWNPSLLGMPLTQGGQGDLFEDTTKPYDVVVESTANLYSISNSGGQQPDMITLAPGIEFYQLRYNQHILADVPRICFKLL